MSPFVSLTFRTWSVGDFYSGDFDMGSIEMRWFFLKMRRSLESVFSLCEVIFLILIGLCFWLISRHDICLFKGKNKKGYG